LIGWFGVWRQFLSRRAAPRRLRFRFRPTRAAGGFAVPALDWVTRVEADVEGVARFHTAPRIIRRLTPFVVPMSMHRMEPLGEGSISEFTLWFGFIPVRWTALHVDVDPEQGFTDIQEAGPFRSWIHRHRYETDPRGGSRIVEHVEYEHAVGRSGLLTRTLFSRPMLLLLFTYRSLIMRLSLGWPRPLARTSHAPEVR
jgi:ligand-binding SRPBCC domain-containing protein